MMFDQLWRYVVSRSARLCMPIVQDYEELEHVFNLIQGCESYLEIGTAEGNSLYILAHALKENPRIVCVDLCERHTAEKQDDVLKSLEADGISATICAGNSHDNNTLLSCFKKPYDVVFIDAGHSYADVVADSVMYGHYAQKYIIFHDICLPDVARAFDWYCRQRPNVRAYKFIKSETYGYGVMCL